MKLNPFLWRPQAIQQGRGEMHVVNCCDKNAIQRIYLDRGAQKAEKSSSASGARARARSHILSRPRAHQHIQYMRFMCVFICRIHNNKTRAAVHMYIEKVFTRHKTRSRNKPLSQRHKYTY